VEKFKELLTKNEYVKVKELQNLMLEVDSFTSVERYQNEISDVIKRAKERFYSNNPSLVKFNPKSLQESSSTAKPLSVKDILTDDEREEVEFYEAKILKSLSPISAKKAQLEIEKICQTAKERHYGIDNV
jgi:hypothetical protein